MLYQISPYKQESDLCGPYIVAAKWIGWAIMVIASLVLLSWFFDVEVGKRILPEFPSMKFNTALCFIASGIILWRKSQSTSASNNDLLVALLSGFILLISGLTLLQYWLGWQLGIGN